MRLADNEEAVAECISIRDADLALRKPRDDDESDSNETESDEADDAGDNDEADDDETNNALLVRQGAWPDLTATLQNTAVDEVYSALTQAWDHDHIRDLANRLLRYLGPAPTDLNIALRRPVAPAQPSQS